MAKVGAQRASELTGVSKSTIQRAMKTGKLSYEVDNSDRRVIDVAELERAFGLMPQDGGRGEQSPSIEHELEKAAQALEMDRLKMRIRLLEDQLDMANTRIDDLKEQRDQWQKQAQQVLLTSQYSQKHAEELKEELRERERRARERKQQETEKRQQEIERRQQAARRAAEAANTIPAGRTGRAKAEGKNFDIQGLWTRIRGANVSVPATAERGSDEADEMDDGQQRANG